MNEQEKHWFEKLTKKRDNFAKQSQDPDYIGMWEVLIKGIYSEDAHFIYELLQNAEDAKATSVKFILDENGLYFIHNGSISFTVTDIDNKDENGHINAITALGRTGKKITETIGKFGIGFKAVFQYTKTPHIYERNFQFKIRDYIVPELIEVENLSVDYNNSIDTVFYFPFLNDNEQKDNNRVKSRKHAYEDIYKKLKELDKPTLFLNNLKSIKCKVGKDEFIYKTEILESNNALHFERIKLIPGDEEFLIFKGWFNEKIEGYEVKYSYSVGFSINDDKLKPLNNTNAYCFFPTKEKTGLNFIIHGPFLLNSNRESIPSNQNLKIKENIGIEKLLKKDFNEFLMGQLAELAAASMITLRDLKLIDDDILDIIPYEEPLDNSLFSQFYYQIHEKFQREEIIPSTNGEYVKKENAYWAAVPRIAYIFSNDQISQIINDGESNKWAFPSKGRDETKRGNKIQSEYIDSITFSWLDDDDLISGWSYDDGVKIEGITSNFIENQNYDWLVKFYKWISETDGRKLIAKNKPIFINKDKEASPAFDNSGKLILFLPENESTGFQSLDIDLFQKTEEILYKEQKNINNQGLLNGHLENNLSKEFYKKFGIREHTIGDHIQSLISEFSLSNKHPEMFFEKTFKYFKNECAQEDIDSFINKIINLPFLPYFDNENSNGLGIGKEMVYPTIKLLEFYKQLKDTKFLDIKSLRIGINASEYKILDHFCKKLGVIDKDPDLKDEVYKLIIPKYQLDNVPSVETCCNDLKTLIKYYQVCPNNEVFNFINDIKSLDFLLFRTKKEPETFYVGVPKELNYPTSSLVTYFESKPDTKFVDIKEYNEYFITENEQKILKEFLLKLGVSEIPRLITQKSYDWNNHFTIQQNNLQGGIKIHSRRNEFTTRITNYDLDGLVDVIENITKEKSILLWSLLMVYKAYYYAIFDYAVATYDTRQKKFLSDWIKKLKNSKWLLTKNNDLVSPNEISINELSFEFEKNYELEVVLGFQPSIILTEKERIAQKFESEEDAELAKKLLEEYKAKKRNNENKQIENPAPDINNPNQENNDLENNPNVLGFNEGKQNYNPINDFEKHQNVNQNQKTILENSIQNLNKLQKELETKIENDVQRDVETEPQTEMDFDEDKEFAKGIEDLIKKLEVKKNRVELVDDLNKSTKYSYDWFIAYIKLLTSYGERQDNQKQKSISFQEIKPYKSDKPDNNYFLLTGANNFVSPDIENAEDFQISLVYKKNQRENITVEGVSKKGQDLLIYCREPLKDEILLRFSRVYKIEIKFTPVINLLDRLYKAFKNKENINEWENIKESTPSLDYIYGPPGTGKTTKICHKINEELKLKPNSKYLILTPTNKAADVVCKKIRKEYSDIFAVRLSHPTDPDLEEEGLYRVTLDINLMDGYDVIISTIHRLPYFDILNYGLLFQYNWDYVVFDESSMIPLHYITFAIMALNKFDNNMKFIVAGDPKQIPPVVEIDDTELENFEFQDENIYKMMDIFSFETANNDIRTGIDSIENLTIQYRSLPIIGNLFSKLSYSDLLKHDREQKRTEAKKLPEQFKELISSNVTFIDVPLNQDNSIYKVNKLFYSSYHLYSAIFVAEIVKYFDSVNKDDQWTIGLIAPYKAQATLLNKLISSYGISENLKVYSDTVHGFQGDECDIVFFVCNPNNYYYSGHEKALLSKEYIYNVAISRAKDYLVIIHPKYPIQKDEDHKQNIFINKLKSFLNKNSSNNSNYLSSKAIEKMLFNEENYIENNSYVTGHDNVNVFGLSDMKYFIKANDTAIDIQLRDLNKESMGDKINEEKGT